MLHLCIINMICIINIIYVLNDDDDRRLVLLVTAGLFRCLEAGCGGAGRERYQHEQHTLRDTAA